MVQLSIATVKFLAAHGDSEAEAALEIESEVGTLVFEGFFTMLGGSVCAHYDSDAYDLLCSNFAG